VDVGFFVPVGNGVGFVTDTGNTLRPRFPDKPWLLLGDPWATAINSRGEPADTDGSFAIPFDNVNSGGRLGFIANEINVDFFGKLTDGSAAPTPATVAETAASPRAVNPGKPPTPPAAPRA
jgi:hypothetical protein